MRHGDLSPDDPGDVRHVVIRGAELGGEDAGFRWPDLEPDPVHLQRIPRRHGTHGSAQRDAGPGQQRHQAEKDRKVEAAQRTIVALELG
jgi:hypothetical protein